MLDLFQLARGSRLLVWILAEIEVGAQCLRLYVAVLAALRHGRSRREFLRWPTQEREDQVADGTYAELLRSGGLEC